MAVLVLLAGCKEETPIVKDSPTVCLLTDYGLKDAYVPAMKGAMLAVNPRLHLVDLTHEIEPYNVPQAAYLLRNAAREFPPGSVFVCVVDPGVGTKRRPILLQTEGGKYFIGPDNGLFSLVIRNEGFANAWEITNSKYFRPGDVSETFHGRDIFGPVAAHLVSGTPPDEIGQKIKKSDLKFLDTALPTASGPNIVATVLHVDRFGNVITNVPRGFSEIFDPAGEPLLRLYVGEGKQRREFAAPLVKTFADLKKGRMGTLFGSEGLLEIIVNQGSANEQLKIRPGDVITIRK
jgi:hypothetical protein